MIAFIGTVIDGGIQEKRYGEKRSLTVTRTRSPGCFPIKYYSNTIPLSFALPGVKVPLHWRIVVRPGFAHALGHVGGFTELYECL